MTTFWALNICIYLFQFQPYASTRKHETIRKGNALVKTKALLHFSIYNTKLHSA